MPSMAGVPGMELPAVVIIISNTASTRAKPMRKAPEDQPWSDAGRDLCKRCARRVQDLRIRRLRALAT